jgi:hypothetical protein
MYENMARIWRDYGETMTKIVRETARDVEIAGIGE